MKMKLNTVFIMGVAALAAGGCSDDEVTPTVSLSIGPETIDESAGTDLVFTFTTEGDIPADGVVVRLDGDVPNIARQFTAAQFRFDDELNLIRRFDRDLPITGGDIGDFDIDGDPESDGLWSDFNFTILEPTATLTWPVIDDIFEEDDVTFTYTLAPGDGYEVAAGADTGTFTVIDGIPGGEGPTVGVTVDETALIESERTRITITFTVVGDIPAEGLIVELSSDTPRAVAEFVVNASDPREDDVEVMGPVETGGNIVGSNEIASSLVFRILEATSSISVEPFQEDGDEGLETFTYVLLDGEQYEVDPAASSATITIDD
ncbi:MAG: hypothetical protein AAF928_09650 [Myxococcota bacterium]